MPPPPTTRRPPTPFEADLMGEGAPTPEAPSGAFLFEVAWEVCNLVGGIYQVVRSKVPLMTARWLDQYCMVGPYIEQKAQLELEPLAPTGWLARTIELLEQGGLSVRHGRWLIQG